MSAQGKVELVTTYFEMHAKPKRAVERACPEGLTILKAEKPPVHFYRYLYNTIGAPWVWWERKRQSDNRIAQDIHDPEVALLVPYLNGVPIGMAELDWREAPTVKLPYFGIVPEYCGLGIGGYVLDRIVDGIFDQGVKRFWLTTCSLDSPRAIPAYLKAGFTIFDTVTELIDDPATPVEIKSCP